MELSTGSRPNNDMEYRLISQTDAINCPPPNTMTVFISCDSCDPVKL